MQLLLTKIAIIDTITTEYYKNRVLQKYDQSIATNTLQDYLLSQLSLRRKRYLKTNKRLSSRILLPTRTYIILFLPIFTYY